MNALRGRSVMKIDSKCLNFISQSRLLASELHLQEPSTKKPLKCFPIKRPRRCVYGLRIRKEELVRLIGREQFTRMEVNLRILGRVPNTGMYGMHLKSNTEMKIHSRYRIHL